MSPRLEPADPVVRAVRTWCSIGYVPAGAPLVVACSGGADSLALALACRDVVTDRPLSAVVVDHGLQRDSDHVAATAARRLRMLGYDDVEVVPVTVGTDGGMEAAARAARYAALRRAAERAGPDAAVLLAHTANDQAETVLLGLGRGSGPRSIAGMRPWSRPWGRPLLTARRRDTENACAAAGVEYWSDPQNADVGFTRVRLRREILPLMDEVLGGGVVPALARTAELMADDLAALDRLAADALAAARRDAHRLDRTSLAGRPTAIRRRVLRAWVAEVAGITDLTYEHLVRLDDLVAAARRGSAVRLRGGVDVVRGVDTLRLARPGGPDESGPDGPPPPGSRTTG